MTAPAPRVVFVLGSYTLGGAETQLASLLEHRPARARHLDLHTVTFLPASAPALAERFARAGVTNTLVNREEMHFPAFFWRLLRVVRELRPDIVHTLLDSSTGAWGRLAARLAGVPAIMHSDLSLMTEGTRAHRLLRPYLDRATARFLPNAEAIAERLTGTGVPRERITVVPCGVDRARFDPAALRGARARAAQRAAWGVPEGAVVAGFLGRFAEVKRLDVLLDAVAALPAEARPDYLVLAGDGPTMGSVRERVEGDAWLRDRCRLLGAVSDTPAYLGALDYLVLPSETEGLPNAVLEGMAMGLPVVATRVSDVPTLIRGCGFEAEPGDVRSLAEALRVMTALTAEERRALGEVARRRIAEHYDLDAVARTFWDAHLALVRTGAPASARELAAP